MTSCSWLPKSQIKPITVVTTPVVREKLDISMPILPEMEPINWRIITQQNAATVFHNLQANNTDPVIFGITDDGYEALSINFARMRHYISTQRMIIEQYKNYYESSANSIENTDK